jgi:hypothetical protein
MLIKEWLQQLADSNSSTEEDSVVMQRFLRGSGLPKATVVYGIVYPEGRGRPVSIHTIAGVLVKKSKEKE